MPSSRRTTRFFHAFATFFAGATVASCSASEAATPSDDAAVDAPADDVFIGPIVVPILDGARIASDGPKENLRQASSAFTLPPGPFAKAVLVVDLTSSCFPFEKWKATPPPPGQRWPAACDAFDRNFETLVVDPTAPAGAPRIELARASTPFGGPEHIAQDVTDVLNGFAVADGATPRPRTLEVDIPTYSDPAGGVSGSSGGWNVSVHLEITLGAAPAKVLAVVALVDSSVGVDAKWAPTKLTLPVGTTHTRIEYRVTGHGGAPDAIGDCIGGAEEFCRRLHHVAFDKVPVADFTPWRADCRTLCTLVANDKASPFGIYCKENPCGDVASVRAPRANWCPGSMTPPFVFTPDALKTPGDHTFDFSIDGIVKDGSWRVTAVAIAYGD